jgi:hypothetical protein
VLEEHRLPVAGTSNEIREIGTVNYVVVQKNRVRRSAPWLLVRRLPYVVNYATMPRLPVSPEATIPCSGENSNGKVRPVLVTPIMSIRGILMTLVLKMPSACIIQSRQERRARAMRSGNVKNRASSTLTVGSLVESSIWTDRRLR